MANRIQGIVRLLEVCPRLSSLSEAVRVLSTQITRGTEAEEGGESKDAAAAETTETLSMIADTVGGPKTVNKIPTLVRANSTTRSFRQIVRALVMGLILKGSPPAPTPHHPPTLIF
jgi:hypothetical protein